MSGFFLSIELAIERQRGERPDHRSDRVEMGEEQPVQIANSGPWAGSRGFRAAIEENEILTGAHSQGRRASPRMGNAGSRP